MQLFWGQPMHFDRVIILALQQLHFFQLYIARLVAVCDLLPRFMTQVHPTDVVRLMFPWRLKGFGTVSTQEVELAKILQITMCFHSATMTLKVCIF